MPDGGTRRGSPGGYPTSRSRPRRRRRRGGGRRDGHLRPGASRPGTAPGHGQRRTAAASPARVHSVVGESPGQVRPRPRVTMPDDSHPPPPDADADLVELQERIHEPSAPRPARAENCLPGVAPAACRGRRDEVTVRYPVGRSSLVGDPFTAAPRDASLGRCGPRPGTSSVRTKGTTVAQSIILGRAARSEVARPRAAFGHRAAVGRLRSWP
jgi:hypothetical protein